MLRFFKPSFTFFLLKVLDKMKQLFIYLLLLLAACQPNNSKHSSTLTLQDTTAKAKKIENKIVTELFHTSQLKQQTFTANAQKAFSIKGEKGTVLIVPKNCFVDEQGQPVKGNIELQLTEAYTMADFIIGNLTTLHNGKPLESGGMLCFTANQNGKELQLKSGASIQVSSPNFKKQKNMSLFEGVVANNNINWINPVPIVPIKVMDSAIEWDKSENKSVEIAPIEMLQENKLTGPGEGAVIIQDNPLPAYKSIKGFNSFRVDPNIAPTFNFSVKKMGWANIDRLYSDRRSKPVNITTRIASDSFRDVYITMAIPQLNMFIPGYKKADNTYGFSHTDAEQQVLPIGQKVFIIATAYQRNQYYFCIRDYKIQEQGKLILNMEASGTEAVKKKIIDTVK
jgi:hypothetical protein